MNDLLRQLIQDVVDCACIDGPIARIDKHRIAKLADYLAGNPPGPKDPFVVILSEGLVHDVQIPYEGYSVEVRDYDAVANYLAYGNPDESGTLADWTEVDEDGDRYVSRVWQV